jgi:hypothetical protein
MKKLTGYIKRYFFIAVVAVLFGCGRGSGSNIQPLYSYNTYYGGGGTDYYTGALYFVISPLNGGYGESYQIIVSGVGTYNLPYGSNQLQVNYLYPGTYQFTLNVLPSGQYIYGTINVYSSETTQVTIYPN